MFSIKIEVLFTTSKKFNIGSLLLRSKLGMGTPFSHTAIRVFMEDYKSLVVFDATDVGVRATSSQTFLKQNEIIDSFDIYLKLDRKREVMSFIFSNLGKEFCFHTLFDLWLNFNLNLPRNFKRKEMTKFTCSEFVFLSLKKEFLEIIDGLNAEVEFEDYKMNPRDLYWILHRGQRMDESSPKIPSGVLMDLKTS